MLEYAPLCMRIYHMPHILYYKHLIDASTRSLNLITNFSLLLQTYLSKCPLVISSQMSDRSPTGLTLNLAFLPKPVLSFPFAISTKGESYLSDHIPHISPIYLDVDLSLYFAIYIRRITD